MADRDGGSIRGGGAAETLRAFLDRLRVLLWGAKVGGGVLRLGAVAAAAAVLNTLVAERAAAPPWVAFAIALAGTASFWTVCLLFARSLRFPGRAAAARRVESLAPEFRNDVESSLELVGLLGRSATGGVSLSLVRALVERTGERFAATAPRRFVSWSGVRGGAGLFAATLVPLAALALTPPGLPGSALRAVVDPRVYWPLGQVHLAVEPGDAQVARGSDLTVRARVSGARPGAVLLRFEGPAGEEGVTEMRRGADGAYAWRFAAVLSDFRYRALAGGAASPWYGVRVVEPPAAGNFEVTYTYPAYTGLGARRAGGSGDLEALRGTAVEISFAVNKDLARAAAVLGGTRAEAVAAGERRYTVAFSLNGEPSYRLELEDRVGFRNGGGAEYAIRYLPDAPPNVELLEPAGTVENDLRAPLAIRFRAADDFGLSRLTLVARLAAGERRQALPLGGSSRSAGGEYLWDVGGLTPAPGEVITAFLEAADNDTITGPKVSVSAPLTIRIADPRRQEEELDALMEKLSDDLVQLLGEELELQGSYAESREEAGVRWDVFDWEKMAEAAARQQVAREAADRAASRAGAIAERLDRGPEGREETRYQAELVRQGLENLRARLLEPMRDLADGLRPADSPQEEVRQKSGFLEQYAGEAAQAAEELVLMAETMRKGRRLAEVGRSAEQMARAEDRLLAELDKLSPGDREGVEEVLKQLEEIGKSLRDLAEALTKENQELPEDFLNSDALKDLDLGALMDEIGRIQELLRAGDVAGAKKAARQLAEKLADLRNRLDRANGNFEEQQAKALERLRGNTLPELERLAAEQRALLERTESIERTAGPRLDEALRRMVKEGNTAAPPTEAALLTPEEQARTEAAAREQEALRERAKKLGAEVAALKGLLPFLPAKVQEKVERAGERMAEAGGLLRQGEPGKATPPERAALAELSQARGEAQGALDEMGQMQGLRQGRSGMPMPMPMGRGGRLPVPGRGDGAADDPARGQRAGGRRGTNVQNFMIPGKHDFQAPRLFREEILKSLRDGYPLQYEERIKDYYQRITE